MRSQLPFQQLMKIRDDNGVSQKNRFLLKSQKIGKIGFFLSWQVEKIGKIGNYDVI